MNVAAPIDPLLCGFYTVGDAARLLKIENRRRIARWLESARNTAPVIRRDYQPIEGSQELSFWDLIEVRFVEHFRAQGVSLQFLRKVAVKAREEFGTSHPFALSDVAFLTDRRRIFVQLAQEDKEEKSTRDVLSGQYEMYNAIEALLAKGIGFHPITKLADEWKPLENGCPNVVVNPRFAYGQPVIGAEKVPTAAIFRTWKAEGDRDRVAHWYGIDRAAVDEAIEFELRMSG